MTQNKQKYRAILVRGLDYWIWFEETAITEKDGKFIGLSGCGKNGNFTNIEIPSSLIIGTMQSDTAQY